MTRRLLLFSAIVAFVLLPILFIWQDREYGRLIEWETQCEQIKREAREEVQEVICSTTPEFQTRNLLRSWHTELNARFTTSFEGIASQAEKTYHQRIKHLLPPHDLVVAAETGTGTVSILFRRSSGLALPGNMYKTMLDILIDRTEDRKLASRFNPLGEMFFGFPLTARYLYLAGVDLGEESDAVFQVLNVQDRAHALFWHYSPHGEHPRLLVVSVLDWSKSNRLMGLKDLVALAPSSHGLAFLPTRNRGQSLFSGFFDTYPEWKRRARNWQRQQRGKVHEGVVDGHFLCGSALLSNLPFTALAVRPLPAPPPLAPIEQGAFLVSLLAMILVLKTAAEKIFLERGPRVSIGLALMSAFLMTALLPIAGGKFLIGIGLHERMVRQRQKAEQALQHTMKGIDAQFQLLQADMTEGLRRNCSDPAFIQRFQTAVQERSFRDLLKEMNHFVSPRFPYPLKHRVKVLTVVGPGKFIQSFAGDSPEADDAGPMSLGAAPILRRLLRQMNPALDKPQSTDGPLKDRISLKAVESEMTNDFFDGFLSGLFGMNSAYRFYNEINQVTLSRQSFLTLYNFTTPIGGHSRPEYLVSAVFEDFTPQTRMLHYFREQPTSLGSTFTFMGTRREEHKVSYPGGIRNFPPVFRTLFDQARILGIPRSSIGTIGTETFLMTAMPGQHLKKMSLGGAYSLRDIAANERFKARLFQLSVVLALLTATLIAFFMFRYFMMPLRDLIEKIGEIKRQRYEVRLDAARNDEFGSVANAFNMMATGLEEGKILGQFVSPTVRRVIQDRVRYAQALKGEAREMTILFSTLKGFGQFAREHDTAETYTRLGSHLSAFSAAIGRHGGEIDKVIGEKVMVFFDHEELGGKKRAIAAALAVIDEVRREMRSSPLAPVMGLNSGNVISGILGARTVRMDYTIIGDTVNLAARLGAMAYGCGGTGVVFSGSTRELLPDDVRVEKLAQTQVKGKTHAIEAFLLVD